MTKEVIDLSNKKILLVRNDNIGDLVCTTPMIEALRKAYPKAQIDIVVNSYNYLVIHNNPFVDTIYSYTKPKHKKKLRDKYLALKGKIKILKQIRKCKYDVVITLRSGYSKSAELFARVAKPQYSVGVKDKKSKDKFNIHIPVNIVKHEVEFCFDCIKPFGVSYQGEKTRFFISATKSAQYQKYKEHILIHISSRVSANQYPKEKFKEVIDRLNQPIIISADPVDEPSAQWLSSCTDAEYVYTQSLLDLSALLSKVKLFVTLDGGAMHIAAGLGKKMIILNGKTNMTKWRPWGHIGSIVSHDSKQAHHVNPDVVIASINDLIDA